MTDRSLKPGGSNRAKTPEGLLEEELLESLAQRGSPVPTPDQMRRRRKLLPKLPGVPDGPGRPRLRYPPAAVDVLEAIMEIAADRKVPVYALAFELWWRDLPTPTEEARSGLAQIVDAHTGDVFSPGDDPLQVADTVERLLEEGEPSRGIYKLLLERVGGDPRALVTGMYAMFAFFFGGRPTLDSTAGIVDAADRDEMGPEEAVMRLMGFRRAQEDVAGDDGALLSEDFDVAELLSTLAFDAQVLQSGLPALVVSATDAELNVGRDDAHIFAELFVEFSMEAERIYGSDFSGLGFFTVPRAEKEERFFRAATVVGMVMLRRIVGREGIETVKAIVREQISSVRIYNAIFEAFPQYQKYLRANQLERLADRNESELNRMRFEINAWLDAHGIELNG